MGRPDGKVVKELPNYRRFMPYFLRHKYESLFYWQYDFKAEPGLEFVEKVSREYGVKATFFHLFTHCLLKTMVKYPGINRFAKGGRIYQRNGIWFSFSVKKERSLKSKVSVVKKEFKPDFDFLDTIKTARKEIKETREGKKDEGDKEAKGYLFFPGFLIRIGYHIYKFMDEHGLFSKRYIE
ncbi:MAG: hypothetical protein U9R75_06340, partial [Candidatus Thermoplasmatota archaeon]|nr:hypothetical protein [Candidatus Thermoplasmatota archaeon]